MLNKLFKKKYKPDPNKTPLENLSLHFASEFGEDLKWEWDARFDTIIGVFQLQQQDAVYSILEAYFSDYWNVEHIASAPAHIAEINQAFGGLKPGQLLFSTNLKLDSGIICVWWPWRGVNMVSIRFMPYTKTDSEAEKQRQVEKMRAYFKVA